MSLWIEFAILLGIASFYVALAVGIVAHILRQAYVSPPRRNPKPF